MLPHHLARSNRLRGAAEAQTMALAQTVLIAGLGSRVEEFLIPILGDHGYQVRTALGVEAVMQTIGRSIDLVLLDLPSGADLVHIATLRAACPSAMIVVGPGRDDRLLIDALELGADDYVARPFRTTELLARIRAQLRRRQRSQGVTLSFGPLSIDPHSREVTCNGAPLQLSAEEYYLLILLAARPGHIYPCDFLTAQVWGSRHDDPEILHTTVARLRSLIELDPAAPAILGGDRNRGYWMGGTVQQARELNGA
jgi:DNA-binding response OmpR family regulator